MTTVLLALGVGLVVWGVLTAVAAWWVTRLSQKYARQMEDDDRAIQILSVIDKGRASVPMTADEIIDAVALNFGYFDDPEAMQLVRVLGRLARDGHLRRIWATGPGLTQLNPGDALYELVR